MGEVSWEQEGCGTIQKFSTGSTFEIGSRHEEKLIADYFSEEEKFAVGIPKDGFTFNDCSTGIQRKVQPALFSWRADNHAVMVEEELRLVEPYRLFGSRFEISDHAINGATVQ